MKNTKKIMLLLLCGMISSCESAPQSVSPSNEKSTPVETSTQDNVSTESKEESTEKENSPSTVDDSSIEESSVIEDSSTDEQSLIINGKEKHKFIDVSDQLFMLPGEEYYLDMMKLENISDVSYTIEDDSYIMVDNNGKITAITNDDEDKATTTLYVTNDRFYQQIDVNVVNYDIFGSYKHSVDLGRLYHKKVVFFGDSITHNWAKYPSGNRPESEEDKQKADAITSLGYNYVPLLQEKCQFASLTNAAWSGGTMAYDPFSTERFVYKSFPGAIEDNQDAVADADYLFVFYGTNDISEQYVIDDRKAMTKMDNKRYSIISSMEYGVNRIRELNEDAIIIFLNVLYRTYGNPDIDDKVHELNEAYLGKMVEFRTKLVDVYSLITKQTASSYLKDGLHPNDAGYKLISDYILNGQK